MLDDEELIAEIAEALEVTGLRLTPVQIQQLLVDEDDLVEQFEEWGADDTDLLRRLANLLSEHLLGESWPTFGESRAGRDVDDFQVRLLKAALARGYTLLEEATPPAP